MSFFWSFLSNYGSIIAGFFAVCGAIVGILSSYASHQAAQKSAAELVKATEVIERLETVIGDRWGSLSTQQVEILRTALAALPFKGTVQIMYETSLGRDFAQSIAIAFRAAQWTVRYSPGGGFEEGLAYGRGTSADQIGKALATVVDPALLRHVGADETNANADNHYFVGVGSKPPKK